jgi:AraC-like DNA-binding protein
MGQNLKVDLNQMASRAHYNARKLAALCNLSPRQFQRKFRQQFTLAPQHWLNEKRIAAAQSLLLSGKPVKVVASELGFKQCSHFCRQFKSFTQMTPSKFVSCQIGANEKGRWQITSFTISSQMSLPDNKCRGQIIVGL